MVKTMTINKLIVPGILLLIFTIYGCKDKLPIQDDISKVHYTLLNEDSSKVVFPDNVKGRIVVMGFIFTNCPDICPMTTNNMQRIQQEAAKQGLKNVSFVSLSFDPTRDTPSVLKQFAGVRGISLDNWHFLTGEESVIDSLKRKMHFIAIAGDTSYTSDGKPYYFFVHTDRISLIDEDGRVRKNYKGSQANINEVVNDIKSLE